MTASREGSLAHRAGNSQPYSATAIRNLIYRLVCEGSTSPDARWLSRDAQWYLADVEREATLDAGGCYGVSFGTIGHYWARAARLRGLDAETRAAALLLLRNEIDREFTDVPDLSAKESGLLDAAAHTFPSEFAPQTGSPVGAACTSVDSKPQPPERTAPVNGTPERVTRFALGIAGRRRASLYGEWRSHLAGETGRGLASRQAHAAAFGFLRAVVAYRLQDTADMAWHPVDAVLASRKLSNLVVLVATLGTAVVSVHSAGLYGLVSNLGNVAVVWVAACGLVRAGRRWRGVKPPKPKQQPSK